VNVPSYQTLDAIADTYTPILFVVALLIIGRELGQRQWKAALVLTGQLLLAALVAYGLMALDNVFAIWPAVGLDYSTHTAVALLLVLFICFNFRRLIWLWSLSLLLYGGLMFYQQYHTLADMVCTALVVAPAYLFLFRLFGFDQRRKPIKS